MSADRWPPGASVVWRSRPEGSIGTVLAGWVVEDTPEIVVLYQPKGAPRKHRTGHRGGPSGRNMLPDGWDGRYQETAFPGPSTVRLHPVGARFSVIRNWDEVRHEFRGWYANLEQPWIRTPIGFDGHDDVLDIRVADDLSSWSWKDEDELEWSVEVGKISATYADDVRRTGEEVTALIQVGAWPFEEAAWSSLRPLDWGSPTMPEGWATTNWP